MHNLFRAVLQKILTTLKQSLCWLWRYGIAIISFSLLFIAAIPGSSFGVVDTWRAIGIETTPYHFDFLTWELEAIGSKVEQLLFSQHALVNEQDRSQFVRHYMADLRRFQELNAEITAMFIDPNIINPEEHSFNLRTERDALQDNLNLRRPIAESILEGQIAAILVDEGFGIQGQLWPPMAMRLTGMPNLLILSRRDVIQVESTIVLDPISIDEIVALETQIEADYDVSALIEPLGGIALYPAMVHESWWLPYVVETFAHEWLHHYLAFHPLGISYILGDENSRKINETTADLFGKEIAVLVLARYYPELPAPTLPTYEPAESVEPDPNAFDYNTVLYETRLTVDELLADGRIDEAETYMEERRVYLYENGYRIRRLNQSYFAFYGRYQISSRGASAGGPDPIGSTIINIRQNNDTIFDFVILMQSITSLERLLNQKTTQIDD